MKTLFAGKITIIQTPEKEYLFETDNGMRGGAPTFSALLRVFQRLVENGIARASHEK